VNVGNPILECLSVPLGPGWTVEGLADQVLDAIVARPPEDAAEVVLDASSVTDRQALRLLRPLLACLAAWSAAEAGTPVNLFCGEIALKRACRTGPVWVVGRFENRPGSVRLVLRRSDPPSLNSEAGLGRSADPEAVSGNLTGTGP
jgi:hypothetical protein